MAVRVRCITDPACVWSWAFEPVVRTLMVEFGDDLEWTFVMGGLAREYGVDAGWGPGGGEAGMAEHWLEATDESGMPTDPLAWSEAPLRSTYPACKAVEAAKQQGRDATYRYLRTLREGIFCRRQRLDSADALVDAAREAGLDAERLSADLGSAVVAAAFDADLAESREVPDVVREADKVRCSEAVGEERVPFPTLRFDGEDGSERWTCGIRPLDYVRQAALDVGGQPSRASRPTVLEAVERFGTLASVEAASVCDLPLARSEAELAQLRLDERVEPIQVLGGRLWQLA
jgi:putative protein-disulfide isomerase